MIHEHHKAILGVLMPGFLETSLPQWVADAARDGLGSVCLFANNTPDLETTAALCAELRAVNPDVLIALDEEGGDVTRLQLPERSSTPGNEALGAIDDVEVTRWAGRSIGELMRATGIHMTLAPCVDVASNPRNPVIGVRSFGSDPDLVSRHGVAFVEGLHEAGTGGCAKHFPGHGDTAVDTHVGTAQVDVSVDLLRQRDVAPFVALAPIVDSVMTAHIVVPALGPDPASMSAWAYEMLREIGFAGPIVTDAVGMRAVSEPHGVGEAAVRALVAGADLLCLDSPMGRDAEALFAEVYVAVAAAIDAGRLDPAKLAASHERTTKAVRAIVARESEPAPTPATVEQGLGEAGLSAARRALKVTDDVTVRGDAVFVDIRQRINWASGRVGAVTLDAINQARASLGLSQVEAMAADELIAELNQDGVCKTLIVLTGEPLAEPVEGQLLQQILDNHDDVVVVHAGMAQAAPEVDRLICSHGVGRVNSRAAAEALVGSQINW